MAASTNSREERTVAHESRGIVLIVVGIVLSVMSLFADIIGFGGGPGLSAAPGFGWKQVVGAVIGVALVAVGFARRRSGREPKGE
jgi:uncharacterized membrane protein